MFEAVEYARNGNVDYFETLTPPELAALLVGRDEDGRTLLHTAAANGCLPLVQLLAERGASKVADKQDDEVWLLVCVCVCVGGCAREGAVSARACWRGGGRRRRHPTLRLHLPVAPKTVAPIKQLLSLSLSQFTHTHTQTTKKKTKLKRAGRRCTRP